MEEWRPISEDKVWEKLNDSWSRMDLKTRRLWEAVKIVPDKWLNEQKYYSHGSWVVALIGGILIWYDDIEEGFRSSSWTRCGVIDRDCWSGEGDLEACLQSQLSKFEQK